MGTIPAIQYEGTKFDLGTYGVRVTYSDGSTDTFTAADNPTRFKVEPDLVQGVVMRDSNGAYYWRGYTDYTVSAAAADVPYVTKPTVTVLPIQRGQISTAGIGDTSWQTVPIYYGFGTTSPNVMWSSSTSFDPLSVDPLKPEIWGWRIPSIENYVMNSGLNLIGDLGQEAYVDQPPDKSKFRLQATYVDLRKKDISLADARWEIRTYYNSATDRTVAGRGDLLVTVGLNKGISNANINAFIAGTSIPGAPGLGLASPTGVAGGLLTAMHPYDKVYHVDSIEVIDAPDPATDLDSLPCIYYWQADNSDTWKAQLNKYNLKINYVAGAPNPSRTIPISSLSQANPDGSWSDGLAWWNENPYTQGTNGGNMQSVIAADDFNTFGIQSVSKSSTPANKLTAAGAGQPFNKLNADDLKVKINYRGAVTSVPVDIAIKVEALDVSYTAASGAVDGALDVNVKTLDNDVAGQDAAWYATKVLVEAVVTTARGATAKRVALKYSPVGGATGTENANGSLTLAQAGRSQGAATSNPTTLYYTMDFGYPGDPRPADPNNAFKDGWGQSWIAKNDANLKAVTFYFLTPITEATKNNTTTAKKFKNSLDVNWINIRAK